VAGLGCTLGIVLEIPATVLAAGTAAGLAVLIRALGGLVLGISHRVFSSV
jgi:hypothetical protein